MKHLKNVLSVFLVAVILITSCPVTAFSVERSVAIPDSGVMTTSGSTINSDGIITTKSVSYDSASGGYNLNIEAYVTGKTVDNVTGIPSDIVVVMDHSNSMKECLVCGKGGAASNSKCLVFADDDDFDTSATYYLGEGRNKAVYYCTSCKAWFFEKITYYQP